ncbi:transposase [Streptomyces pseudogriseolus]|uniref:transposase n=1 Tax=Streptomyces pseudogriseolus TaxID=36817 RepID=UPI003FA21949
MRAHQHAAGARGPAGEPVRPCHRPLPRRTDHQIHLAADHRCRPLAFDLTAGQAGDAPAFTKVMARLRVPRRRGRPGTTPDVVLADKAYSSRAIRSHLRKRGIRGVIPERADQQADRMRRGQAVADRRPSTGRPTSSATPSSSASTASSSGAASPPAMTRPRPSTWPDSTSRPGDHSRGCAELAD